MKRDVMVNLLNDTTAISIGPSRFPTHIGNIIFGERIPFLTPSDEDRELVSKAADFLIEMGMVLKQGNLAIVPKKVK